MNQYLKAIRISGGLLLAYAILMLIVNPRGNEVKMQDMFQTPVVALELVKDTPELSRLVMDDGIRERFKTGILLDYGFIVCYSVFMMFLVLQFYARHNISRKMRALALFFIAFAAISDVLENMSLTALISSYEAKSLSGNESLFHSLYLWTMIKWESLGIISLVISLGLFSGKRIAGGVLFFLVFFSALLSLQFRVLVEVEATLLALSWLTAFLKSLPHKRAWWFSET